MKIGKHGGFTIIEILIVLSVTGLLLLGALVLVAGRQGQSEFKTSVNETQSQIQSLLTNVSNGYYPSNSDIACTSNADNNPPVLSSATQSQGTNQNCIFLGYVFHFYSPAGSTTASYDNYTVAGRQCDLGSAVGDPAAPCQLLQSLANARPILLAPSVAINTLPVSSIQNNVLDDGVTVYSMTGKVGATTTAIGSFAILSNNIGTSSAANGSTEQVGLYIDTGLGTQTTDADNAFYVTKMNGNLVNDVATPASEVDICLLSGSSNESALLTISANNGGQLTTAVSIKEDKTC